ncbi:MAG: 50S ribosomal protein L11 methyltransferase [Magnetococcales bacterium]|nr:50S ribosomal protein L11 methyltransferase [Magnetococcales bacterium]
MVWEVQLLAPEGCEDACRDLLAEIDSLGSVMEWLPEVGARVRVKGYFPDDIQREETELRLLLRLSAASMALPTHGIQWQHLPDRDWAEAWKKDLKPFCVGQHFLIRPSWWPEEETSRHVISLDPGLAFGSGTHETTSGCLEALEWIREQNELDSFLDMGCGSGILAMGGALLGADPVTASDLDPQAITTATDNFHHNHIHDITTVLSPEVPHGPYKTIAANILSGVLLDKADGLVGELQPGGWLILAGLLEHQAQEVIAAYTIRGMVCVKTVVKSPWVILVLFKPVQPAHP